MRREFAGNRLLMTSRYRAVADDAGFVGPDSVITGARIYRASAT